MSGTDRTELSRIREEYGDLMNEEEKEPFPMAEGFLATTSLFVD